MFTEGDSWVWVQTTWTLSASLIGAIIYWVFIEVVVCLFVCLFVWTLSASLIGAIIFWVFIEVVVVIITDLLFCFIRVLYLIGVNGTIKLF